MKIYLDNAATTPIDPEVVDAMIPVMREDYGNPSSTHSFGRKTRSVVEVARREVAQLLHVSPGEICFTSGGTEADNMAIHIAVDQLGIRHAITSRIEHHAVGHTLENLAKKGKIDISYVKLTENGHVDLDHLRELLRQHPRSFVSLMHANNEIGNLLPLKEVGDLCKEFEAVFHSDTVQTLGHYHLDLRELNIDFVTCAAHKFHGPKGVGFLYINENINASPFIHGGAQERNQRGGTENVYGIVGLSKALQIALRDQEDHQNHVQGLKSYMIARLEELIPGVAFNGDAKGNSLYTVLNVCFPPSEKGDMLLFNLDIMGIAASGGSACSSGSNVGSHVLQNINTDPDRPAVRFSFSKFNTQAEIDYCLQVLAELFAVPVQSE